METKSLPNDSTLIIGAGLAGLFTALEMAPMPVTVITAAKLGRGGSSRWAQGGLAAAVGDNDKPEYHFNDTMAAGAGLVDFHAAKVLVEEGPARVEDLIRYGVEFDRDENGKLKLGMEAAHGLHRIVHVAGDQAGAAIMEALIDAAHASSHITLLERTIADELIIDENGRIRGALLFDIEAQKRYMMSAQRTVMATGGIGGLYAVTTNPKFAQGHGIAMALRVGAEIMDPEFVQFHPTGLDLGIDPAPLATEALRGDGCHLVDNKGHRFMTDLHEDAELAPRDIVARGVAASIAAGNGAFLDARTAIGSRFKDRYPTVYKSCQLKNIDPSTDLMPVAPAVHYHMGGIRTDIEGRTTMKGLWAVGEAAATGVHGANRLASNSLLEALVFGKRVADSIRKDDPSTKQVRVGFQQDRLTLEPKPAPEEIFQHLRNTMTAFAGLLRTGDSLKQAAANLNEIQDSDVLTSGLQNAVLAASLICLGGYAREESRGGHARTDFPETSETRMHTIFKWTPETNLTHHFEKLPDISKTPSETSS